MEEKRKGERKMTVLATPMKNSYIFVNKESAEQFVNSHAKAKDIAILKERAEKFKTNNLKKK